MMEKKNSIKKIIVILFVLFMIVIAMIFYLVIRNPNGQEPDTPSENSVDSENTSTQNNTTVPEQNEEPEEQPLETLEQVNDTYSYFLINNCLKSFYNYNDYVDISLDFIDTLVIENLKLHENNFINLENSGFCIDEIYEQKIGENENIYVVYYRLGQSSGNVLNRVCWVRINSKDMVFSIFPYEYLSSSNQLELKTNDIVTIDNTKAIEKNNNNTYEKDEIKTDRETYLRELFRRYKFDLLLDVEHLYNTIDTEYKNLKFQNIENLEQYINENKTDLYLDGIDRYKTDDYLTYVEYTVIGDGGNYYIFHSTSLMEYTLYLDNYTVVTEKNEYEASLPNPQARYCIDRVFQAIQDKDYEFVYGKLNPVQKNNYYQDFDAFQEFMENLFYEENSYEIEDEYLIISSDVYQYTVKIMDASKKDLSYRNLTMTVTLKENADFTISIVN